MIIRLFAEFRKHFGNNLFCQHRVLFSLRIFETLEKIQKIKLGFWSMTKKCIQKSAFFFVSFLLGKQKK